MYLKLLRHSELTDIVLELYQDGPDEFVTQALSEGPILIRVPCVYCWAVVEANMSLKCFENH